MVVRIIPSQHATCIILGMKESNVVDKFAHITLQPCKAEHFFQLLSLLKMIISQ